MTFTLQRHRIDKVSPDAVIAELRRVAEHYDFRYFTGRQFNQVATICKKTTVLKIFGSWEAALRAAGVAIAPSRKPRSDQILEAELFAELGRIWRLKGHRPSRAEWETSNPRFSYTTYKTRFSGWTNACVRFIEFKSDESLLATPPPTPIPPSTPSESTSKVPPSKSRNIPLRLRVRVFARDHYRCVFVVAVLRHIPASIFTSITGFLFLPTAIPLSKIFKRCAKNATSAKATRSFIKQILEVFKKDSEVEKVSVAVSGGCLVIGEFGDARTLRKRR